MRISALRSAIQTNNVSFPAQTPCFNQSRADIQWRLVQLYFVRGWTCVQLARRYRLTRQRIEQLLAEWVDCASTLGYLQEIPAPIEISVEISAQIGAGWLANPAIANQRIPLPAGAGTGFPHIDELRAHLAQTPHTAPL